MMVVSLYKGLSIFDKTVSNAADVLLLGIKASAAYTVFPDGISSIVYDRLDALLIPRYVSYLDRLFKTSIVQSVSRRSISVIPSLLLVIINFDLYSWQRVLRKLIAKEICGYCDKMAL